jgi:predicted nucleotidyltransferase
MTLGALTRSDVETRLAAVHADIRRLGVSRLALFGSVQRGVARADSDVDVLVEFREGQKTYRHFFALAELLEAQLGRTVELVTLEALSPFLKQRILAEAADVLRAA